MNKSTLIDHPRASKTFIVCLVIVMMILSPLAPLASAAPSFSRRGEALRIMDPAGPVVPTITATKTDSFPDPNLDGKAEPGDTITYDININNSGTDATGVSFSDTIDPNTTLVAGSLKVSPLAFADTYSAARDTQLSVGAPSVLTNDTGLPAPTAVPIAGGATTQGGTVTLNADGSFIYNPAAGFVGADTFTYKSTNGLTPNDTAVVTINVDAVASVVSTTPSNGATNQALNTNISINFSEPVDVTGNWFQIACTTSGTRNVADTVVTGGPTNFTINPNVDFVTSETCTVTVFAAQVTDQDTNDPPDNLSANFVFSFATIDAAPTVTNTTPTNGATQVANNTNVSITFSEPVNVTGNWFQIVGASSGTRNVADTVVSGGPTTFTINPNADFTNGELVTVTVFAAQVADQDANDPPENMAANFVFSFTIDQAPAVTTTVPTNGVIDVLKTSNIVINFNENVNANTSSFTIACPAPGNLRAFTVLGSGTNAITLDPTADLPQGVICTATVIANQISDTDSGDPPDNMVADFVFSFGVKPEAVDDARNATGNIRIQTAPNSGFSVLSNDIGPGITVTTSDSTSLRGGNVTVAANGVFTYNPPAGYEGADSFNYTISNPAGSDVGTVNITITGMPCFVNSSPAAVTTINDSCGRLTNPFSTLAAFEAANGNPTPLVNGDVTSPEAGDHLFIYTGAGSYNRSLKLAY